MPLRTMDSTCDEEKIRTKPEQDTVIDEGPPKWRSTRFFLAYFLSLGLVVIFYQRVSFSMAIVCMVNHTALDLLAREADIANKDLANVSNGVTSNLLLLNESNWSLLEDKQDWEAECQRQTSQNSTSNNEDGPFVWNKELQGLLLGALYWGYTVAQLPGSYAIHKYGARLVVGISVVAMSVFFTLCHPASLLSPWAVFALRVAVGLCTALAIPGMYSMWGRWAPVAEKSQLLGISFAGQMIANASVFPFTAMLCDEGPWGGWPSVFYVFGGLGVLWSISWFVLIRDAPELHPRIDPKEKDYIMNSRAAVSSQREKLKVPWRQILSSWCFWAIAVAQFTYNWGFFLMISNLPTFMYETMHFDIRSNGVFSMLPYISLFIVMSGAGFLSDFIIRRRFVTVLGARKLYTVVAYIIPAILLVAMSHMPCTEVAAVMILLVIAVGLTGLASVGGFFINPYDIAPRFAVNICTATNTMATMSGVINPYVVAAVTKDQTREQWQTVFYITAVIFLVGTVFFCIFAKAEVQPWAKPLEVEMELNNMKQKNVDSRTVNVET